jgi:hypothetical protein
MSPDPVLEAKFKHFGLSDKYTNEALKSEAIRSSLATIINQSQVPSTDHVVAALLFALATSTQKGTFECRPRIIKAIFDGRIKSSRQVEGKKQYPPF